MRIKRLLSFLLLLGLLAQSMILPSLGAEPAGDDLVMKVSDMVWSGNHRNMTDVNNGVKCTFDAATDSWERVGTRSSYLTTGYGATSKVVDITSAGDKDYSFVTKITAGSSGWYDAEGYMIVYGYSGNFAIIATSSNRNPNKAPVIVSEVREPLGGSVEVAVKLRRKL